MMSEVQENVLDDQNPDYTDLESLNGLDRPGTVFLLLWNL